MSRVHFVGGEKGGVGKSVLGRLLCQWCVDHGAVWSALDADPAQGKLLSGCGARAHAVELSSFRSADRILELALGSEREVVVDLPAHSRAALSRWLRESDAFALAEERDVRLVFWCVTDGGFDSVSGLERLVHELPATVEVVVVRNRRWAPEFVHLEDSPLATLLAERGARSIDLPALDPSLMYRVEERKVSWTKLLTESPSAPEALSPMARQRLALWLGKASAELEPVLSETPRDDALSETSRDDVPPAPPVEEENPSELEPSVRVWPSAGVIGSTGARTWTEVGDGYQVHHVRYP